MRAKLNFRCSSSLSLLLFHASASAAVGRDFSSLRNLSFNLVGDAVQGTVFGRRELPPGSCRGEALAGVDGFLERAAGRRLCDRKNPVRDAIRERGSNVITDHKPVLRIG